ncbi:MAG: hypothetical protein R2781_04160 [Flavobacteriaceae bacterium]
MKIPILLLLTFSLLSCSSNLKCDDFRNGNFYIESENDTIDKIVIVRKRNSQKEWVNEIGNGKSGDIKLNWIDECTYRINYDETSKNFTKREKLINDNNGILVEKIFIIGRCMNYKATMKRKDGKIIERFGKICKE